MADRRNRGEQRNIAILAAALLLAMGLTSCGSSTKKEAEDVGTEVGDLLDVADDLAGDADEDKGVEPEVKPDVDVIGPACNSDEQCKDYVEGAELCKVGKCVDGSCTVVSVEDGTECDDDNDCTTGDECSSGTCTGTPIVCNTPPVGVCKDATTVMGYKAEGTCIPEAGPDGGPLCNYEASETVCPNWCVDGVCVDSLGLLQAAFTPAGSVQMAGDEWSLSCVMPGWLGGEGAQSSQHTVQGGFEP